jgi:hypothetical protein
MLILLLAGEVVLAFFLFGSLVTAAGVKMKHGDSSATYKLSAIRDRLVGICVFEGVARNNEWLEILYSNVSSILLKDARKLTPLPENEKCPPEIWALQPDLRDALENLVRHHTRLFFGNPRERSQKRLQREQAKSLVEMIERAGIRHRVPKKSRLAPAHVRGAMRSARR